MALVSLANVDLSIGQHPLLDGVNLLLSMGEHVGLVGRNGCGKTTLLRLITGDCPFQPTAGQVQIARETTVGYLAQDPQLEPDRSLRQEAATAFGHLYDLHDKLQAVSAAMAEDNADTDRLMRQYERLERDIQAAGGFAVDHRIDATLHGVGLGDETFDVRVADLSGGQRGRLALAKLLLSSPHVLLLDEPTNHLDIAARHWLEEYLRTYSGAVVLVSHDRWLLDRVVSKIHELDNGQLIEYPGNYRAFRELRAQRQLAQRRLYDRQQEHVRREQGFIDRYRAGQRSKQAQGREKRLERLIRDQTVDRPVNSADIRINIPPPVRSGDQVLRAQGLSKSYDDKTLFRDITFEVHRGDRIGIIGPNGCGKTTLVNCLLGCQQPDTGKASAGAQVDPGYLRQVHDDLDLSPTIVQYLQQRVPSATEQEARDLAGAFGFSGLEQDKPLSVLSGGERSRTVLAGLIVGGHNLLVLDEPTNHLDIPSAERLEESLCQFLKLDHPKRDGAGTLLLITHDRMLLDDLVDQLLIFDGQGAVHHFFGRYSDYQAQQDKPTEPPPSPSPSPAKAKTRPTAPSPPASRKMTLARLETRIAELESQIAQADTQLADPDVYRDGQKVRRLMAQRDTLAQELTPLERQWLELAGD